MNIKGGLMRKIPVIVMTRTCGYYANVRDMNLGKQQEVSERKFVNKVNYEKN